MHIQPPAFKPTTHPKTTARFGVSFKGNVELANKTPQHLKVQAIVVPVVQERGKKFPMKGLLKTLDKQLGGVIGRVIKDEGLNKAGGVRAFDVRPQDGFQASIRKLVLVSLPLLSKANPSQIEDAIAKAFTSAKLVDNSKEKSGKGLSSIAVALPDSLAAGDESSTRKLLEGTALGLHKATYKTEQALNPVIDLEQVTLFQNPLAQQPSLQQAIHQGEVLGRSISFAKDLSNAPPNLMTAKAFAERAKALGNAYSSVLKVKVTGDHGWEQDWLRKNTPAFYAVGQAASLSDMVPPWIPGHGVEDLPRLIQVTYTPPSGVIKKKIALVGKSVMFDTGGLQGKGDHMNDMKFDMTGGANVLATMKAIAELQPDVQVTAYMLATPNLMGNRAYKPDDIIDSACGKKIEIGHTDAEGRLTLIDGVHLAVQQNPDEIITMATLTGAAVAAVGNNIAAMGNNPSFVETLYKTAKQVGDPVNKLEVEPDDYKAIGSKRDGANLVNIANPRGQRGAQTAAAFVISGLPKGSKIKMAHLDIAGVMKGADGNATGIGVKTLIQHVLNSAQ